jgi:ATP-binding cassette subfamily C (CFTR/MRP) protein 10
VSPSSADAAISAPSEIDAEAEARAERALLEKGYLTAEESRVRGSIRRKVLGAYVGFVGSALCALILLSMVLMQASRNGSDWVR